MPLTRFAVRSFKEDSLELKEKTGLVGVPNRRLIDFTDNRLIWHIHNRFTDRANIRLVPQTAVRKRRKLTRPKKKSKKKEHEYEKPLIIYKRS